MTTPTLSLLYAVNYMLPEHDYRVVYARTTTRCTVSFALPVRPAGVPAQRYHRLGFTEGLGWRDVGHAVRLAQLLLSQRGRLDVAHFYSTKLLLMGPVLARLAGVRPVITVTGFGRTFSAHGPGHRLLQLVYLLLFRLAVRLSSAVLFQNTADLEDTARRLPSARHKMSYIGSAIDMPVHTGKSYAGQLQVILVARIMPAKGIQDFLAAAHEVAGPKVRFVLVGAASKGAERLQREVEQAHADGVIDYQGRLTEQPLREQYGASHILCFPSRGEGLARVMIEAGFSGLCPVAYDIPGNRDLLVEGTGVRVPAFDQQELVAAVRRLCDDREELRQRADAYQRHVTTSFDMRTYRDRMDLLLDGLSA
jgi:glycosyltransferase involved in cell wall biosynthesis